MRRTDLTHGQAPASDQAQGDDAAIGRTAHAAAPGSDGALPFASLADAAATIVANPSPAEKTRLTRVARAAWSSGRLSLRRGTLDMPMPDRPGRPVRPALLPPRAMPRRSLGTPQGRIAFLHAIAHIELNAVDLAWDIVGRFAQCPMPCSFYHQWVEVAAEEATHFELLGERLAAAGAAYGDHPAHDGLWQAAGATGGDLTARLAIVPLVLEARGLDVTPSMIEHFTKTGDAATAAVLSRIYEDEKGHVFVGASWFRYLCDRDGQAAEPTFHSLVRRHFRGAMRPPFNDKARSGACLTPGFYRPLETVRS